MDKYDPTQRDWEHPSIWFVLEDVLKGLIGGPLVYTPYFKTFGLKGDEKVIDFGCGGGVGSRCLADLLNEKGRLTCIDISNYWINKAKRRLKKYDNVECKAGDIRKLKLPDHSFDVISIFYVTHDIAPEDRQDTVNTLAQLLNTNGTVFIREPTKRSHGMPTAEIRNLFSHAGLKEVNYTEKKSEYKGIFRPT